MSIHPSLSSSIKQRKQKSVLKRTERLKILLEKGEWDEKKSVFGLPKIKTVRIKIKKEKAVKEPEAGEAAAAGKEGVSQETSASSEKAEKSGKS